MPRKCALNNRQSTQLKKMESKWIIQFNNYLEANLSNASLNVPHLAKVYNMSEATFLRKFKQRTGMTPVQYIQEFRLQKGKQLLESKKYTIAKAATAVGYKDYRSFSRLFKQRFGFSPSEIEG